MDVQACSPVDVALFSYSALSLSSAYVLVFGWTWCHWLSSLALFDHERWEKVVNGTGPGPRDVVLCGAGGCGEGGTWRPGDEEELSSLRSRLASSALRRSPSPPRVTGGLFSWRNSWRLRCEDDDAERWLKEVAEREMGMVAVSEKEYDPDGRSWYVALLPYTSPLPSMPSELLSAGAAAANGMEEGAVKVEVATDLVLGSGRSALYVGLDEFAREKVEGDGGRVRLGTDGEVFLYDCEEFFGMNQDGRSGK